MTSRAVHLEVAHALTVDSFLNAFRRFLSRRGKVHTLFSDNGTNFVGAEKELRRTLCEWNTNFLAEQLRQCGIRWQFNPPSASHIGGVWERLIRSAKKTFNALLLQQRVTDGCLSTLMTEVEYILNSRPLIPIVLGPEAQEPLTPNHLLLCGHEGASLPPGLFSKSDCYSRKRWKQVQYLAEQFWRRWTLEYIQTLQPRQKWQSEERNLVVDDIVLLYEEQVPRSKWQVGRVVEVYPDTHGRGRQVQVKTKNMLLRRPVTKLCRVQL